MTATNVCEDIEINKEEDENKNDELSHIKRNNEAINVKYSFELFDEQSLQLLNNQKQYDDDYYNDFFNFSYRSRSKKRNLPF